MKWIYVKDELPEVGVDVLIYEGQKIKTIIGNNKEIKVYKVGEYSVGHYNGKCTRKVWVKPPYEDTREEIETYNEWVYNKGFMSDEDPIAWAYIDEFKEN